MNKLLYYRYHRAQGMNVLAAYLNLFCDPDLSEAKTDDLEQLQPLVREDHQLRIADELMMRTLRSRGYADMEDYFRDLAAYVLRPGALFNMQRLSDEELQRILPYLSDLWQLPVEDEQHRRLTMTY